jgi:hypothetical protein
MPTPKRAVRDVSDNRVFHVLARSGFAVNGLIHILIGSIAIGVSVSDGGGGEADQAGALKQIATTPGGLFVIWAAVVGLFALALWQVVRVVLATGPDAKTKWGRRVTEAGKALVYLAIGGTALIFALGGTTSGSETSKTLSAEILATPGGVFLLIGIGLGFVGTGIGFVSIGLRRTYRKLIRVPAGGVGRGVEVLGVVGYVAKGIALGVVGVLFVVAAVRYEPEQAAGLDGALKALADLPYGVIVLGAVGVGLIAYGVFLCARARLARL